MPVLQAHSEQTPQSLEDWQGIGSWVDAQNMPSNQVPDKDVNNSVLEMQNPTSQGLVKQSQTNLGDSNLERVLQDRQRVMTETGNGVNQSRFLNPLLQQHMEAHISRTSGKAASLQRWLSEPARHQPWNATSRIRAQEKKDTELRRRL